MVFDRQGRCLAVNGPGLSMMGLSESEVLEKNFCDLLPEESRPSVSEKINQVLDGKMTSFEAEYVRPDGTEVLWNLELKPIYGGKGRLNGFVSIGTDITKYRKAEDELERYREHLQKLVDLRTSELKAAIVKTEEEKARSGAIIAAIGDGFSIHDTDFRILYQNQVAKDLLGDHVGEYCFKAYMGIDSVCERCHIAELFKDGKVHKKEGRMTTDKGILHTEITASPLRDSAGKIVAGIEVVRDITARKVSEETLRQTNERLRTILEASPAAIIVLNRDGIVTLWNKSAQRIFGWSEAEVTGQFYPIIAEGNVGEFRALLVQVLNGRSILGAKVRRRKKDGSPVDIMISAGPLHDTGGVISSILAVVTDITAAQRTEQDLKLAHSELEQIFNTAADGMVVIDKDFNILRVNDTFLALLGVRKESVMGRKCHEVFPSDSVCHTDDCPMRRILRGEESVEIEVEKPRHDGTKFPSIVKAAPFRNTYGAVIGIVEDIRDVSERKKMQEAVMKARNLESIGLLAGGIAHDFNNLLQGVLGNISIAQRYLKPDDKAHRYIEQVQDISGMAKSLTGQLLTFSRGGEPVRRPVLIGEKLRDWVNFALSGTNLRGEFDIEEGCCLIEVDEGLMRQVIQNLVLNARDATPYGGTLKVNARKIYLGREEKTALKEGIYMKISITDRGTGIPEKNMNKIFDPYFSTKDIGNQKGMGLGLAICHSIMEKHGGAITVESREGIGSTFAIYMPVSEKEIPGTDVASNAEKQYVRYKGKVLIMDDEKIVSDVARVYLNQLGYECEVATDGTEAIEMYKYAQDTGSPFDMVILDLTVPGGLGGEETIAELLKIDPRVKALVSSGYSQEPIMSNYRQPGFLGAIAKPYTLKELDATLSGISGHTRPEPR
jgi:PAS domain S-box-containing protein